MRLSSKIEDSSNPAFKGAGFRDAVQARGGEVMSANGAMTKTGILLSVLVVAAAIVWGKTDTDPGLARILMIAGIFGSFIVAMVMVFKPTTAPFTAPLYAALEGLALGAISATFNAMYPGIVSSAIVITVGMLGVMVITYKIGLIRATPKFKRGMIIAIGAIGVYYIVSLLFGLFGGSTLFAQLNTNFPQMGLLIQGVIIIVAALSLVLDFDMIEKSAQAGAPKFMEWYCAGALLITLAWLYLEILKLLALLRGRD